MVASAPNDRYAGAAALLKALAAPVRLAVVTELGAGPRCVHELLAALREEGRTVSQPLISQHLRVLREAGLVSSTRRAQEVVYQLADAHVARIVADAIEHSAIKHGAIKRGAIKHGAIKHCQEVPL